jgi:hypothetical protein
LTLYKDAPCITCITRTRSMRRHNLAFNLPLQAAWQPPRYRPMVQLALGLRRYSDVPLHLWHGKRAMKRAANSARARAAVAANQSHRENRTCICAPSQADQRYRDCPLDEFAAGALGFRAQCAAVRRCTGRPLLQHGCGGRCSQIQPRRRSISHSRASCVWSRATERRVACRRLLGQVQMVVWPFGISDATMRSHKTRGQPASLRRSYRCASRPCLASVVDATTI